MYFDTDKHMAASCRTSSLLEGVVLGVRAVFLLRFLRVGLRRRLVVLFAVAAVVAALGLSLRTLSPLLALHSLPTRRLRLLPVSAAVVVDHILLLDRHKVLKRRP